MNCYLKRFGHGSAATEKLWEELDKAASASEGSDRVKSVMSSWTLKEGQFIAFYLYLIAYFVSIPGYPLLTLEKTGETEEQGKEFEIFQVSQQRFFYDKKQKDGTVWPIPIKISTSDGSIEVR